MTFVAMPLVLPFVAVMIRGVSPYFRMTFVAMPLVLPFVAVMIRGVTVE